MWRQKGRLFGLEDVRAFQVQLVVQGISWPALNQTVCALLILTTQAEVETLTDPPIRMH
jgi:hypothetical protein